MLFCLTGDYTLQGLEALKENPHTHRHAAVEQLLEAAGGGKMVGMYTTDGSGPGVMLILDVADADTMSAITGVFLSAGTVHNPKMTRLHTMEDHANIREKALKLRRAYKPPGKM